MKSSTRTFTDAPAVRGRTPLLIGITGCSSSGKTYSALRLGAGLQRVVGGDVWVIDTEAGRAKQYAPKADGVAEPGTFVFRHVPLVAPFGPLDYLAAFEHCIEHGAKIIVVDQMTHEHSGIGGVLDQMDEYLDKKCGDDYGKRERHKMLAHAVPKAQRKMLNARIVQLGINAIFCYRAQDKIKPAEEGSSDRKPQKLGWQPETTSPLFWDMTVRFLLLPGSDGKPTLHPQLEAEKLSTKLPEFLRPLIQPGVQLTEDLGEKLARWAAGEVAPTAPARSDGVPLVTLLASIAECADVDRWRAEYGGAVKRLAAEGKAMVAEAGKRRREELRRNDAPPDDEPPPGALSGDRQEYVPQ